MVGSHITPYTIASCVPPQTSWVILWKTRPSRSFDPLSEKACGVPRGVWGKLLLRRRTEGEFRRGEGTWGFLGDGDWLS